MPTVLNSQSGLGDAIKFVSHPAYCYEGRPLKNTSGEALALTSAPGQPVKGVGVNWEFVLAGDEASTDGILCDITSIELADGATSTLKYCVLVRGPAIVCKDGLPVNDIVGDALDHDAIATALEALEPRIQTVVAPPTTTVQTINGPTP